MTAIIDPPWPYTPRPSHYTKDGKQGDRNRLSGFIGLEGSEKYPTLDIAALGELPVAAWVDGYVLCWTTGPFCHDAHHLMEQWGFPTRTMITWVKTNPDGTTKRGGVGHWYLGVTEYVLIGKKAGMPSRRTKQPGLFTTTTGRHSGKPPWLHEHVERFYPSPWLELFARRPRDGWLCMGNELDGFDIRESLTQDPQQSPVWTTPIKRPPLTPDSAQATLWS